MHLASAHAPSGAEGCRSAVLRMARQRGAGGPWIRGLLDRKRPKAAAVALANKTARIAWVLMAREEVYKQAAA